MVPDIYQPKDVFADVDQETVQRFWASLNRKATGKQVQLFENELYFFEQQFIEGEDDLDDTVTEVNDENNDDGQFSGGTLHEDNKDDDNIENPDYTAFYQAAWKRQEDRDLAAKEHMITEGDDGPPKWWHYNMRLT